MSRVRDDRRRNRRGSFAAPAPLIREDGLLHNAEYDPATGVHTCLPDCPSCAAITTKHGPK